MHRPDPTIETLRDIPALRGQSDQALKALARLVDNADVPAGHRLTREGVTGRELFIVVDGEADVFVDGEPVAAVGPGDFVGEMAMLDLGPRSATVRARTSMRVLVVGPSAFGTFIENGGVIRTIAAQLAKRLRRTDTALVESASHPPRDE